MNTSELHAATNGASVAHNEVPQFGVFLDSVPALIAYIDKDLRYQYVNAAYEKWLGKSSDSIIGKKVYEILGNETFDTIKTHVEAVLNGNQTQFEYSVTNQTGLRYIDVFYTPYFADRETIKGYIVHINDITEKKHTDRKLRDYVENATIGLHWVNRDGIIIWANKAELNMLGYSREEYIGRHISDFHANEDKIKDILQRLACNESLYEYEAEMKCKDGSIRHVSISSNVYSENGEFMHTRCFTIDITKRKKAEQALRESEAHYSQLVRSLPVAFYTCDAEGRLSHYNEMAAQLWGYAPPLNSESQKFCAFNKVFLDGEFYPADKTPMAIAVRTGESFRNLEPLFVRADGKSFNACVNIDPLYDGDGKLCGAINVFQDITQLKAMEAALRESEAQYRQLLELLPSAVYTCDKEGRIKLFNQAAVDLWGRTPVVGKDMWCGSWKIFDPHDGSPVELDTCPMAVALKEGRAVKGAEIVVERPDGIRRNVAPNPRPIMDHEGNIVGAVNMLIDITEQKEASRALRESEKRFRLMADLVPIVIWTTDDKGNCSYVNSQWTGLLGRPADEAYGHNWMNFIHPDDQQKCLKEWQDAISERKPYTSKFRYAIASGQYTFQYTHGNPHYDEKGNFLGYLGIFQNVTDQEEKTTLLERTINEKTRDITKTSEDLRKTEERYQRMINEVQDYAIILLSSEGNIENWNMGAEKIKGYPAEEILGKNFRQFYTIEDQKRGVPEQLLNQARATGKSVHEGWRVRKDGSKFWGSILITALHNDKNEVIGFSKVTRDLTQKKAAEDELRENSIRLKKKNEQLQRMNEDLEKMNQELASFAYISSHDLQEPLRKIQSFSSRIAELDNENMSEKSRDYFNRIQAAARRMRLLIDDLLTYSRANTSEHKFSRVDLNQIILELQTEMKEEIQEKNAKIVTSALPTLRIIPFQFYQLIANIVSNALKFSTPGIPPEITISASIVKGYIIKSAAAAQEKTYHHISIKDNGIGFDPAYSTKIFEIFQRLHNRKDYEGTGIGLAICKKIVENHGGIITAEGQVNEGATFNIYLPV